MLAASDGSTSLRNRGLLRRSGEMSSTSTSSASIDDSIDRQSSMLEELMVAARMPAAEAEPTWLRMSASSGDTTRVGPAPSSRSSRVAIQ